MNKRLLLSNSLLGKEILIHYSVNPFNPWCKSLVSINNPLVTEPQTLIRSHWNTFWTFVKVREGRTT